MKKLVLNTILLLIIFFPSVTAQINQNLFFGVNTSKHNLVIDGEFQVDFGDFSFRQSLFFGTSFDYQIKERFGISLNVQSSKKGTTSGSGEIRSDSRIWYLDIIPEIEFTVFKPLVIGIGVNYGFNILEEQKFGNGSWVSNSNPGSRTKNDLGLTTLVKLKFKHIIFFGRYNFGLTPIIDFPLTGAIGDGGLRFYNENIQIGVGIPTSVLGDNQMQKEK